MMPTSIPFKSPSSGNEQEKAVVEGSTHAAEFRSRGGSPRVTVLCFSEGPGFPGNNISPPAHRWRRSVSEPIRIRGMPCGTHSTRTSLPSHRPKSGRMVTRFCARILLGAGSASLTRFRWEEEGWAQCGRGRSVHSHIGNQTTGCGTFGWSSVGIRLKKGWRGLELLAVG